MTTGNFQQLMLFKDDKIISCETEKTFKSRKNPKQLMFDIFSDSNNDKIITEKECKYCKYCNNILPITMFTKNQAICKPCRHIGDKIRFDIRYINKKCKNCDKPSLKNRIYCFDHWFLQVSFRHFKSRKYGNELINLWEKQNHRCVYTNVELIPGDNMSLDHIISKYDNPDLAQYFNNVQWVHKDINSMKTRFSHDAFITLCKYISQKFS